MEVISAGLPRTATTTTLLALERLGFAPCQHMRDLMGDLEGQLPLWERAAAGDADWEQIMGDARSCADAPAACFYRELLDYYPDAKVVLGVREAASFVASMRETVWACYFGGSLLNHICRARAHLDPLWDRYLKLMTTILWDEGGALYGDTYDDGSFAALMEAYNDKVKSTVPADKLLVWKPQDGWTPLCEFLEGDVPDEPVPNVNDKSAFVDGIITGSLAVINAAWQARTPAAGGLHGAPASH